MVVIGGLSPIVVIKGFEEGEGCRGVVGVGVVIADGGGLRWGKVIEGGAWNGDPFGRVDKGYCGGVQRPSDVAIGQRGRPPGERGCRTNGCVVGGI